MVRTHGTQSQCQLFNHLKLMNLINMIGHKITTPSNGKTNKRQDEIEVLYRKICLYRFMQIMITALFL